MNTISQEIPTFCIRYEDLVSDPVPTLLELFEFLFEVPSLKGTVCEERIKQVTEKGTASSTVYKLKSSNTSKFNRSAHMYNTEQVLRIKEGLKDLIQFFGYADHPTEENDTAFFHYDYKLPGN